MNLVFNRMYLRPGNLWHDFTVYRKSVSVRTGHPVREWEKLDDGFTGVLAEASTNDRDRTKHLWDQDQHSLTHTVTVRGEANVIKGDRIEAAGRTFLVLVTDDMDGLRGANILYVEERKDLG